MEINKLKNTFEYHMNFPKKGVNFVDVGSVLRDGKTYKELIDLMIEKIKDNFEFDKIVAFESRGFLFGCPIAYEMEKGFAMLRKTGKLPGEVVCQCSIKEYGEEILEIQKKAINPGEKILLIDDVLATGGTAQSAIKLIENLGGVVAGLCFVGEIPILKGSKLIKGYEKISIFEF